MRDAPVVACEISDPPTTPRGTSRSSPDGLTTFMAAAYARGRSAASGSGRHAGELAAGDVEHLAVHEVRPRRAQEEHARGRLLGRAGAAEGDDHRGHGAHLLRDAELHLLPVDLHRVVGLLGGGEARLDPAEGDGVDVDLELAPL